MPNCYRNQRTNGLNLKENAEKQKWQKALNANKLGKEMMEMKEQIEKWIEEQQAEWKNVMENKVNKEKSIQAQLVYEKILLVEKSKETEKAILLEEQLKEQEAKGRIVLQGLIKISV